MSRQDQLQTQPFHALGFAENNGRYVQPILGETIEFYHGIGELRYYFSKDAIVFGQVVQVEDEGNIASLLENEEEEHQFYQFEYFKIKINDANNDVRIRPDGLKSHTMNFQNPLNLSETRKSGTYDRLIYENIYDQIDLVFELPEEGGLKYRFEVKPGGNYRDIQMEYIGTEISQKEDGGLMIFSESQEVLNDIAPQSFVNEQIIQSLFRVANNNVSFWVEPYDESQLLIIDPWINTGSPFALHQLAYEVEYDNNGEVTILGNWGDQVAHYNSAGTLEWVWMFPDATPTEVPFFTRLGDLSVDRITGNVYVLRGLGGETPLFRLNSEGSMEFSHGFDFSVELQEVWRLYFNETYNEIWVGGGNPISAPDLERLDADFGSPLAYNILSDPDFSVLLDVALLEMNPRQDTIYFLSAPGGHLDGTPYINELICVSRADPLGIIWNTPTGHVFSEANNLVYHPPTVFTESLPIGNGYNGIACGETMFTPLTEIDW